MQATALQPPRGHGCGPLAAPPCRDHSFSLGRPCNNRSHNLLLPSQLCRHLSSAAAPSVRRITCRSTTITTTNTASATPLRHVVMHPGASQHPYSSHLLGSPTWRGSRGSGRLHLVRASSSSFSPSPMELVRREAGLLSNRLDTQLRERVETAVERLGGRVTVGDVAARAGVKVAQADEALKALAYDTEASLQVSSEGNIVYGFAPDFRSRLRNRSIFIRAAPLLRRAGGALAYLARVGFGTALIASVVVVWLAVTTLLRGRDDRDDNRGGGGGGGYQSFHAARMFMNTADLFMYWDPYYYRTSAKRVASGAELSFVQSIFSFVFGDGNPNEDFEERRWQRLGEMIRSKGGVVTAEEMAPYLDPPEPRPPRAGELYVPYPDESFVLPALIKFGGEPNVDEQGRILYSFPTLQLTGVKKARPASRFKPQPSFEVPLERPWAFSAATTGQLAGTVTLGLLNLLGVATLSGLMADPRAPYMLAMQGLGWVVGLMGPLQLYAAAFFAIPAGRWLLNTNRNRDIDERNEARALAADLLNSSSSPAVEDKVAAARRLAKELSGGSQLGPRLVADSDIIFDSGRELAGQLEGGETEDWEQQLAARERGRGAGWR